MPSIGIGIGTHKSSGVSKWTPLKPLGGETPNLWLTSRSGLSMVDAIGGNNATITLPTLQQSNNPLICVDNGGLDIGASAGDFTFAVRCKSNSTLKTSYPTIGGKGVNGSVNGMYYFYQNITTGKIHWVIKPTGTAKDTEINLDFTGAGWVLLLLEIDKTGSVGRCFINGVQQGADVAYTGTWSTMANQFEFLLGKANNNAGSGYDYDIDCIYSEAWVYNRKFTSTEKTTITNFGHITDLTGERAHWICDNINPRDLSGNGYHLNTLDGTSANTSRLYSSQGSRYLLDKGYSRYGFSGSSIKEDKYVGYKGDGTALVSSGLIAGYSKITDHTGNMGQHNLADSYLTFVGANWSRDNTTIFGEMARQTAAMTGERSWYLSGTPKLWHSSEFNRVKLNSYFNSSYKGIAFPRVVGGNSVDNRVGYLEILGYASNKTGADYNKALTYTGDRGHSWDISYFFSDTHYCTTRGNKILAYDGTTTFSLSNDKGATFPITKSVAGYSGGSCQMAWITASGNIYFGSKTKMYYSFDSLTTVTEMTVQSVGGGAFAPGSNANFTRVNPSSYMTFGGSEALIWGNYSITTGSDYTNANVWQLKDGATVLRSIYNYTGPSKLARHTENIFQAADESVYIQTGDGNGYINILKGICNNLNTYDWTFSSISPSNTNEGFWHWAGGSYYNGYLYAGVELTPNQGIWRALYSDDLTNTASYKRLNTLPLMVINMIGNGKTLIASDGQAKNLAISNNGLDCYMFRIVGGADLAGFEGGYFGFDPPNSDGYFMGQILANGETWEDPTTGQVIMLKIVDE